MASAELLPSIVRLVAETVISHVCAQIYVFHMNDVEGKTEVQWSAVCV
jgi:hypothetical protein